MEKLYSKSSLKNFLLQKALKSTKAMRVAMVAFLMLSSQFVFAHAVQVGYVVLPNGFIRVYIEHWHGNLDVHGLQGNGMSITTTYGTTSVTQNVNPTGAFNGYAWNQLPGAGSNIKILSTSSSANYYNTWAYYDFAPAACNVPVNIVLNGGLTVVLEESESQIWPQTISGTFSDTSGPTITPINTTASVGCGVSGTNVNFSATAVDNCTQNPAVTFSVAPGSFFNLGTTNVTAYSTDENGNTTTFNFPVTVNLIDNAPPVISGPANQTSTNCITTLPNYLSSSSATDNCSSPEKISFTQSPSVGTAIAAGSTVAVTITATDQAGNQSIHTFNVNKPISTIASTGNTTFCEGDSVKLTASAANSYLWSNGQTTQSIYAKTAGNYSVTTYDANGCGVTSVSTAVTVKQKATVNAGNDVTICPGTSVQLNAVGNNSQSAGTGGSSKYVLFDAYGGNGNFTDNLCNDGYEFMTNRSFSQTISGSSISNLNFKLYYTPCTNQTVFTFKLNGNVIGSYTESSYTCQCGDGQQANTGQYPKTFSYANSQFQQFLNTTGANVITVDINSTSSGVAVSGVIAEAITSTTTYAWYPTTGLSSSSIANPVATPEHTTTYTVNFTAENGCPATDQITVYVDESAPVTKGKDITLAILPNGSVAITPQQIDNGSSDSCGPVTLAITSGKTTFDCEDVGHIIPVVLSATDQQGHTTSDTVMVSVTDPNSYCNQPPVAVAKALVLSTGSDCLATATAADFDGGSTDPNNDELTFTISPAGPYAIGVTAVTLTVTDPKGASSSVNTTVTVVDDTAPIAIAQNVTVQLNASGVASTTAEAVNYGSTDACGIASITLSKTNFDCSNVGANEVVLTVTDSHGNVSTANAVVTVEDKVAPVALAQNVTVQLNSSGVGSTTAEAVNYGSSDACGIASMVLSKTNFDCSNVGANEVVLTVTDKNGNVSTANAVVTVEDKVAPVVLTKNITIQLDANGAASITDQSVNNGSSDNCGIQSVVVSKKSFDCSNVGANTVTLTVTDIHGNVSSANATVTVEDKVAPIAIAKNLTINLVGGVANITPEMLNNGSSDACGIKSLALSRTGFDCSSIGNHTVTLTVTDKNNNISTTTAVVTIVGEISGSSIASLPTSSTYTGGNANNLYLGYGAQSTTLKVTPSVISGNGTIRSYTYVWSGSAVGSLSSTTSATPVFTPTVAGNYNFTVTVTNAYGCKTSSSIAICVKDIREVDKKGAYTGKVFVCHVPNGDMSKANTLSISPSAVAAHLGNHDGDKLGTCDQQCGTAANTLATTNDVSEVRLENSIQIAQSSLTAYPNPFAMQTTVEFKVAQDQQKVSVEVYDLKGVKVKTIYSGPAKAGSVNTTTFDGSYLAPGVYFFRLITPTEALNFKAIKTE